MQHNLYLDHTKATIAAVEYVISKYSHHSWFNHQLRAILKSLLILSNNESFKGPLIIHAFKDENGNKVLNKISGYHYLIDKMEEFDRLTSLPNVLVLNFCIYSIYILLFSFLISFYYWYFNHYIKFLDKALSLNENERCLIYR